MNKENVQSDKLQNDKKAENITMPKYVAVECKKRSNVVSRILIWVAWLIVFNIISVLLPIDLSSYGATPAVAAFIYMGVFFIGGRFLCSLWDRFSHKMKK